MSVPHGSADPGPSSPTTPPGAVAARPGVVVAAVVVWAVLGALIVLVAVLFGAALAVPGAADPSTSVAALAASTLLLLGSGIAALVGAFVLLRGGPRARTARTALTSLGVALAAVGLVQVTFRGVGGTWFVAFVVGVGLLHLPAARAFFARDGG